MKRHKIWLNGGFLAIAVMLLGTINVVFVLPINTDLKEIGMMTLIYFSVLTLTASGNSRVSFKSIGWILVSTLCFLVPLLLIRNLFKIDIEKLGGSINTLFWVGYFVAVIFITVSFLLPKAGSKMIQEAHKVKNTKVRKKS